MLSEDQIAEFKAAFDLVDKDGNGIISIKDLPKVMNALGRDPNEISMGHFENFNLQ